MKTQECDESGIIDHEIGKEISRMKFESNQVDEQTFHFHLHLHLSFGRNVERFDFFEISILECIDVILSIKYIFCSVSPLWLYFEGSFDQIAYLNVNLNFFWNNKMMIRNIKSKYLLNMKDGTDYHPFFSDLIDRKESDSSFERNEYFCSSVFCIENSIIFSLKIVGIDNCFLLKFTKDSASDIFFWEQNEHENANANENANENENENENQNANEITVSKMDEIGQLLKFSGGSGVGSCSSFSKMKSPNVIEIEDSVEIIGKEDFKSDESLKEVIFSSNSQLREISGFCKCISLCRIELPSSVEVIQKNGFFRCTSLKEIHFSSESKLREISGFCECTSLCRIELPSSIEVIGLNSFFRCTSLKEIHFSSASELREIDGFCECISLCRIELPSSIEVIGLNGFFGCRSLKEIYFSSNSQLRMISGFHGCMSLCRIEIPSSVEVIGLNDFFGCKSLKEILFHQTVN
jgi:hypothetical protein